MDQSLSWTKGQVDLPLIETTIGQALDDAAERWPDTEAVVSLAQGVRWSWRELVNRADAMAAGLLNLGLTPGDRIGIWSPNCAEWILTQYAAARIGLILTTINPAFRSVELAFTLNAVGAKAIVAAERFKTSDYAKMLEDADVPCLEHRIKIGGTPRQGWLELHELAATSNQDALSRVREISAGLDHRDPINIQFTSGTTGLPKGATLSHRNILNNGRFVGLAQRLDAGDRICVPVPLYHCFGLVLGNVAGLTCGATVVYPGAGFDPEATLRAIEEERCTSLYGVPTMFIAELGHPDFERFDLTSLRTGIMAGSPCPIEVMKQVIDRMHMTDVTIAYGMTETSPVSFQSAVDDPIERRVATIGRVQPHLEVRVIDESGETTPRGVPGEFCTRGYSVMLGYWNDPERTADVVDADGWMHTGDLGTIDEQGYGNVVGRLKDLVIRGGENIYPREIEEFLISHPKIADVQVVGVPDHRMGEELCAWIRLASGTTCGEEEIREFCFDRIAHFKIPRYIRFVDDYPLTASGKVKKFVIRDQMIQELHSLVEETA